ncbi:UDP-2,4-diacetamido-2,4,6-trideoxy-beta-L-altropyranose hydrolase [Clostridium bornimense]|uniref:UDP-2,4-diacetamido-2,4, 6-trideoxy-beta-L-altropyranose hydrolase n=1 Tax=Clostridium bornimense TaxID=1216932 RepID=UPI001C11B023|nr:UDP-2,4-diacetamido-2,4,6-trideoxy-beta-L-altropyranose hydrolase [Clostridium bornimense]MBU5314782.1 UDP-2,4-diacetamido-2,4,6-trideoxy-beta-L-altropyranose hydrolase [Clostridium bornimense]
MMKKKVIYIRADGGSSIGMGHIMRTMILANELKKKYKITYVCLDDKNNIHGIEFIKNRGFKVKVISKEEDIFTIIDSIIIVDKYNLNTEYYKTLETQNKVILFDDNCTLDFYYGNIVLNQNAYAKELKYKCNSGTKLLLGNDYTLLREEFRMKTPIEVNSDVKNIMITLGGSDDRNLTEIIIKQLIDEEFTIHIIIGQAFRHEQSLKKYESNKVVIHKNSIISDVMKKSDILICGCGSTIYEGLKLGLPIIGITLAENQVNLGKYLSENNIILSSDINNIKKNIVSLDYEKRCFFSNKGKSIIDGNGYKRVISEIMGIL